MRPHLTNTRCQGLTLIELMVAITISLLLLAGVIQIFMANRTTYRLQESLAYVQEGGRFAESFMSKDMRMVGFMGCISSGQIVPVNNLDNTKNPAKNLIDESFNGTGALAGYHFTSTLPAELTNMGLTAAEVVKGTDIILVRRAAACSGGDIVCHNNSSNPGKTCPGVSGNVNSAEYKIADNSECQIKQNDIVLITNCQTADIHGVTNNPSGSIHVTIAHGANLNKSPKLSNSYGAGSSIMKMTVDLYYVGFGSSGEPALFRRSMQQANFPAQELVPGIYNMTLEYGVDTDSDNVPNKYVPTASVNPLTTPSEWERAVSARVRFDIRSEQNNVTSTSSTYSYNGVNVTDRRLRKSFTTTVTLRNRV